jgi:hypothetical protein
MLSTTFVPRFENFGPGEKCLTQVLHFYPQYSDLYAGYDIIIPSKLICTQVQITAYRGMKFCTQG